MLKEICKALLEADVNVKLVKRLQENVKCVSFYTITLLIRMYPRDSRAIGIKPIKTWP